MGTTLIIVYERDGGAVVEYVPHARADYRSVEDIVGALRATTRALEEAYGLPREDLAIFEGGANTVDSFFCLFPNLKRTEASIESRPGRIVGPGRKPDPSKT